jgi:predicted ester cyclase
MARRCDAAEYRWFLAWGDIPTLTKEGTMSDTRTAFDSLTDAMNRHDLDAIADGYGQQVVVNSPDGTFEGRQAATAYLESFLGAFPDLTVNVWSKVTSGDLVCDEWTLTGTNTGPLPLPDGSTLPATGKRVELRGCDIAALEDGQVISHRLYYDNVDFLTQLGIMS